MKNVFIIGFLVLSVIWITGCTAMLDDKKYHVEAVFNIYLPDCKTEKCFEALQKIEFHELLNIKVDAMVEKQLEATTEAEGHLDATGGKLF